MRASVYCHQLALTNKAPRLLCFKLANVKLMPWLVQRKGQTVLVTAAAGGTGQLAVQLAVLAGCHVIGTCSGGAKAELLR